MLETEMDYQIADHGPARNPNFRRCLAFPEGVSSHTKIATPDPIEGTDMKIAGIETPPGIKVVEPEAKKMKVATHDARVKCAKPSIASVNGDFRRPIQLSGGDARARRDVGMKLYTGTVDPTFKVKRRR